MNPKKIDDFLADSGGWGYVDVQATDKWYEDQRKRYLWYKGELGKSMLSFYNPRVVDDYERAKLYNEHFRNGMQRVSAGQPTDGDTAMVYWQLAESSTEVLDNELDVLYGMMSSGLIQLFKLLPAAQYKGILNRLLTQIPVLQEELKAAEKEAKEAGYQLVGAVALTAITNLLPPAKWTSVAVKAIGTGVQIYMDEELGGAKSSEAMEALDAGLDFGVSPTLVAIEALETKMKDSKGKLADAATKAGKAGNKAGKLGDLLGLACDADEYWATKTRAAKKRDQLNKAVADMKKALNDLEDANAASWKFRQGARMKLAEAERKMEEKTERAEELREEIWDLEADWAITEYDTPVWY